jgi:hypothetical protein
MALEKRKRAKGGEEDVVDRRQEQKCPLVVLLS